MLVEDDDTNRKLVRVILGGKRYRIREATSADQALEMLRADKPDLLLLDIRLGEQQRPGCDTRHPGRSGIR